MTTVTVADPSSRASKGLPTEFKNDMVWDGVTLASEYNWTYVLTPDQLDELDAALAHFKSLGLPLGYISQETFPLPKLHAELRKLSYELHNGHGFFAIRGLRVDEHTRGENIIIYAGLSSRIAPNVVDLSLTKEKGQIGSPTYTADKQVFHTDAGDIVSLFALSTAAEGGKSIRKLASIARHFEVDEIPPIAEAQAEALDTLHSLGDKFAVNLDFQKGDIQYANNMGIFHARDGFTDTP
ncbi:Clavaminate synthase-like protein [Colletotrichum somersetense]|nr:Clavaminate synthase-like protein [Colletotrichum somersetense]